MQDIMLDLETLGNGPDASVVQIGACYFDRNTGETGATFKVNVNLESAVKSGAKIDSSTVLWWLQQSKEAVKSITEGPVVDIADAFLSLRSFLGKANNIWSHATFDFVIINETFKRLGIKPFYSYRAGKDIRTLMDLAELDAKSFPYEGLAHDALEDCLHQVNYCVKAINSLRSKK